MTDLPGGAAWIRVSGLSFNHGPLKVLKALDLELKAGRHYILAGPNGAGKSTFLDLLSNLKKPAGGGIIIKDRPLSSFSPLELARILALAPQGFKLNFAFSVREVVAMGRRPYLGRWGRLGPEDHEAVDRAIADMNLEALARKSVMALSGGERQRVVAARALAQSTPILLLDEPTAGLDIAHALALMDLARRKAAQGALVLTVTHDLNLAAAFGQDFIFLKNGRLAAAGPLAETFTEAVLSEVYEAEARVTANDFVGGPEASFRLSGINPDTDPPIENITSRHPEGL